MIIYSVNVEVDSHTHTHTQIDGLIYTDAEEDIKLLVSHTSNRHRSDNSQLRNEGEACF